MPRIFIVDDDMPTCELLREALLSTSDDITIVNNGNDLLEMCILSDDVILLDLIMPNIDGIEILRALSTCECRASIILISGYDERVLHSAESLAQQHELNVIGCFDKPIRLHKLVSLVDTILLKNASNHGVCEPLLASNQVVVSNKYNLTSQNILEAIENKQIVLYFQPQIDLSTNLVIGTEALVRWQHPKHGLIFPDQFIAMAEETGVIEQLTEEIIALAIHQNTLWRESAYKLQISVNISANNVKSLSLPEQLMNLVSTNQITPSSVVFEVTESALMGKLTTSIDILTRLRMKGFNLSIDDFGTGFSSLSQLHRIPFTELKIDQSFVNSMVNDAESRAIVETCIMLGHKLNMKIVAEGVETKDVLMQLIDLKCDIAQGYFISRPLPAEEITKLFESGVLAVNKVEHFEI